MTREGTEKKTAATSGRMPSGPVVFVVATPIGNLGDLSERAIRTIVSADIIAAEDTRQTRKLLSYIQQGHTALGTATGASQRVPQLIPYHDHNEEKQAVQLIERIVERSEVLVLVSDAGTPCISDPGYRLVDAARRAGIDVHPVPGPSAVMALASSAGLPTDRVLFIGFPPVKTKSLETEIRSWVAAGASVVFFESTRRLAKTLGVAARLLPGAAVAVGRELTKLHEEIFTGSIEEAIDWASSHATFRGEASVMIDVRSAVPRGLGSGSSPALSTADGSSDTEALFHGSLRKAIQSRLYRGESMKDILRGLTAEASAQGVGRKDLYRLILDVMAGTSD